MDLSPFSHVPKIPGGDLTVIPLLALTLLATVLTAVGLAGFHRPDLG
jgi:ABC-2 type transport system permease protein